jgi:hypothetical protein
LTKSCGKVAAELLLSTEQTPDKEATPAMLTRTTGTPERVAIEHNVPMRREGYR